jgi:hypothetical protein
MIEIRTQGPGDRPAPTRRRPFCHSVTWPLLALTALSLLACSESRDARRTETRLHTEPAAAPAAVGVVDSVFPIEEEMRRFREGLPEVTALSAGAGSRDELVDRFLTAIERADTAALRPLLLTRSEFAYLYYPHTMYTRDPYELSPALLWFQLQNATGDSLTQIFRVLAGKPLHWTGYHCENEPKLEGPNRVWSECSVTLDPPDGDPVQVRLFGSVLERGGVFKLVSYAAEI